MLSVVNNVGAMNAQRQFNITGASIKKSMEKLSSGYKINRAADDAAGLTISEKMRSLIRGMNQGSDNIQDGISVCQIMDGALAESHEILHRMTELSVKASNGTLTPEDRQAIQCEINQLIQELDRTAESTQFNTKQLLAPTEYEDIPVKLNGGKADVIFVIDNTGSMGSYINNVKNNLTSFADGLSNCNVQYGVVEYGDTDWASQVASSPFMTSHQDVINRFNSITLTWGGDGPEMALEGVMKALDYSFRDDVATKQVILVTDAGYHQRGDNGETAYKYTTDEVKQAILDKGVTLSVVTSSGYMNYYKNGIANGSIINISENFHDSLMSLASDISTAAGEVIHKNPEDMWIQMSNVKNDGMYVHTYDVKAESLGVADLDCTTEDSARGCMEKIEKALDKVSEIRSNIGAEQNRLEHSYANNNNKAENMTAAESRIRDTDMAKEMVAFTTSNILSQAGSAMLSQTMQSPQSILQLLS